MLCAVTDATSHDLSVAVFGVPLSPETFSCRTFSVSLSFGHKEGLNWLCEPEAFSTFRLGTSFPPSFGPLESAPEAADWSPGEASPVALRAAVLVVDVLVGLLLGHSLDARRCHRLIDVAFVG